jgi:UDPglucose 6-dehydrogenase
VANIGVIGTGYVGLTTSVCFSKIGHKVVGFDIDKEKIHRLNSGKSIIFEEGLEDLLREGLNSNNLFFTDDALKLKDCDFYFLCVPTPQDKDGSADLSYIFNACLVLRKVAKKNACIVTKSTVPVNAWREISNYLNRSDLVIVSNPEFLREGTAINDFFNPDRIVVGSSEKLKSIEVLELYKNKVASFVITDNTSAELIKYASNSFLAMKLSFVNDITSLCEKVGANSKDVLLGFGQDKRIGDKFIKPGPGWGGSCFPKDVKALLRVSEKNSQSMELLVATVSSNEKTFARVVDKLENLLGGSLVDKKIAGLGLSFKAGTDDYRDSPAIAIIDRIVGRGAQVSAFDPVVEIKEKFNFSKSLNLIEALQDSDAIVILTEWNEFSSLDPNFVAKFVRQKIILDARNILDKDTWERSGFKFESLGNWA